MRSYTASRTTPRYNRCDYCGRNAHKVALRWPDGTVEGVCPSCYDGKTEFSAKTQGATVLYDRRSRKPSLLAVLPEASTAERDPVWHRSLDGRTTPCGLQVSPDWLERWDWTTLPAVKLCHRCTGVNGARKLRA
jgi:hypothetical protein